MRPMRCLAAALLAFIPVACGPRDACSGDRCGTLVFAAVGEPDNLLPPVTENVLARDIHDQIFLKLADIGASLNTVGDSGFVPQLADRWSWDDSLTLVFHLDTRARWQDGPPVTAQDVAFSFEAYRDSAVNSPFAQSLARIGSVTARDSHTVAIGFRDRFPEMFYTAVYNVRILPQHLLAQVPRAQWATAEFGHHPVGDGPYRLTNWQPGVFVELTADTAFFLGRPHIPRLVWRIEPDHPTAVTRVLAGEADALEVLVTPDNVQRAKAQPRLATYQYPGTNYGFLGFNLSANGNKHAPHPIFGDRDVRRALTMALDREKLKQSVFGDLAKVPPGPIPAAWPLWTPRPRELAYDTAAAARLLTERGWVMNHDGVRQKAGQPLAFHIIVPATSGVRRQYARLIQEQLRGIGARVELDELEGPVFGQRAATGHFDAVLGIWNVDPTPSTGIADLWTGTGIGGPNWVGYSSAPFEQLVARASAAPSPGAARDLWKQALETFNDDAPAVMLFAADNVAAVDARVADVSIRPDSYWALVRNWRIPQDKLNARDRAAAATP